MSLRQKGRSMLFNALVSPRTVATRRRVAESRRRLGGKPHIVRAFLQLDDPYSYLLSCYLPALQEQYDIELQLHLSEALGGDYQPESTLLAEYAVKDCADLAFELGIPFLDRADYPPVEFRADVTNVLAARVGDDGISDALPEALACYWRGDGVATHVICDKPGARDDSAAKHVLQESAALQKKLGHYNSAMLHYGGEWYWGVDRLHYLEERLAALGTARDGAIDTRLASLHQAMDVSLPIKPPAAAAELPPIELFFSFRSPYSHIALFRIAEIAAAFGLDLVLRPVLPLVMRGVDMPKPKLIYIGMDASREASRRGVPFGHFLDPLGSGVERCLAVFQYAQSERRERDFSKSAAVAIWSEGTDLATDEGMRTVCHRAGLFWPDVTEAMRRDDWQEMATSNRESMMRTGLWGVPVVRMGDFLAWGQDRDWLLVRYLEEECNAGDGIIV